ncbi:UNVERIFIED_CONTAM: hypothetical protein FKN15_025669 [Acipenser sinensis]
MHYRRDVPLKGLLSPPSIYIMQHAPPIKTHDQATTIALTRLLLFKTKMYTLGRHSEQFVTRLGAPLQEHSQQDSTGESQSHSRDCQHRHRGARVGDRRDKGVNRTVWEGSYTH